MKCWLYVNTFKINRNIIALGNINAEVINENSAISSYINILDKKT